MRPEFVDNRNGNTLARAIAGHLAWLRENRRNPLELSVAAGYFDPQGFAVVADEVEQVGHVRLLLGAEPLTPRVRRRRRLDEPRGERYDALLIRQALHDLSQGLRDDRDLLGFTPETDASLRRLLDFMESGRMEVRRYERRFLHGKAFVFSDDEGVLVGSSNFTAAGLISNLELNLGRYDTTPVAQVKQWFDDLWEEAAPYDLAGIYAARFQEYSPYLIYLRFLWELYHSELEAEKRPDGSIPLTTFQNDGIFRAQRILQQYHGVLVADGVGLGKTFIAGELIREAVQERRQRVLLISPAALRDGTWARFADRFQLHFESISYEQLARETALGAQGNGTGTYLNHRPDEYGLIIIDEAQAFRSPTAQRSDALRRLLQGDPPKDLVLLSATPVNNSLWDLYYLLSYFIGHDAVFASRGIRSLRERFQQATDEDPFELRPDVLFDVLDLVCVRRTRHFVRRYYPNDVIQKPDGTTVPVRFPTPHAIRVSYKFDEVLPGFFDELRDAIAPEDEHTPPTLKMARYSPSQYRQTEDGEKQYEAQLVGLLRSALLKRFESSAYAFCRTLRTMIAAHERFLNLLKQGVVASPEILREIEEVDNDEALAELLREGEDTSASEYDLKALKADVSHDHDLLLHFATAAGRVTRDKDPKLAALADELAKIARQAERDGLNQTDKRNRRKVLVFTYFADTVEWIEEYLKRKVETDKRLSAYRGRIASVSSDDSRGGVSRASAIYGFAPESTEAPAGKIEDKFDIMVTTDVLAEGLNFQQACHIINYDLPWNPMRIVQRNGRIDRIGSTYTDVYLRCFFPDKRLDEILALEERLQWKLAQAAASIGVEYQVIPGGPTRDIVFTETRAEIEKLRREESDLLENAGEDPKAHTGEEYRQELRKGLETWRDQIKDLPWAAGSGYVGGDRRGHVFCAKVGDHVFYRFVPADGEAVVRDTLTCLGLVTCSEDTPRELPDDLRESAYGAWDIARQDIYTEWALGTDPANLQPRVRRIFREAAEHLRKHPPADITQPDLDRIIDAVEAPWGTKIERQLREVMDAEDLDARAISQALVHKIHELGLRPYEAPEPLPVIDEDEVQLVAWMGVEGPAHSVPTGPPLVASVETTASAPTARESEADAYSLAVDRTEFVQALKNIARFKRRGGGYARLSYADGELFVAMPDVTIRVGAQGTWPKEVATKGDWVKVLARVPPERDPVIITFDGTRVVIGTTVVPSVRAK